MTDLIDQAKDLFSEEIDAFAGTYHDIKDYVEGKPVHTSGQKWAKRAIVAATTVIPVGLSLKATSKGVKVALKGVKASAHLSKDTRDAARLANADEIRMLKKQQKAYKQAAKTTKQVGKDVKEATRVAYHATGDADARKRRNAAAYDIAVYAQNPQELKKMATKKRNLITAKMRKDMMGGAADAAIKQLSSRKYKKKPMDADDLKIMGAQVALGALKGARGVKTGRFGIGTKKNDKHWYTKLGTNLVGLNFAAVDRLGLREDALLSPAGNPEKVRVTTDAVIDLMLTVPDGSNDPFTVASAKLANEMRLHSGANTIYAPVDIMEYLINARSIMAGICQVRRIITSFHNADPTDVDAYKKYTLAGLGAFVAADGSRYGDTRRQIANALTDLNAMIKAVGLMIPINMPIMKRTEWLFSNGFADGKTSKHSVKMFIAQTLPTASIDPVTGVMTITQDNFLNGHIGNLMSSLRTRVNAFVVSQKHMAIAGDIMKVYGREAFWAPAILAGDEVMPILYDEEALTQIQNMTVLSSPGVNCDVLNSKQTITDGHVSTAIKFTATGGDAQYRLGRAYSRFQRKVVQTYKPQPDGGDVLELSRLTAFVDFDDPGDTGSVSKEVVCGTELVVYYGYMTSRTDSYQGDFVTLLKMDAVVTDAQALQFSAMWSIDDWGPFAIIDYDSANTTVTALFDFETWAAIAKPQMSSFHYIAGVSLYTNEVPILKPTI